MTAAERSTRAAPVLAASSLSISDVTEAMNASDLTWNKRKAAAFGITPEQWLLALEAGGVANSASVSELLVAIHQAESAAGMIRAGYRPDRDASGKLNWAR